MYRYSGATLPLVNRKTFLHSFAPVGSAKSTKVRNCEQCHVGSMAFATSVNSPGPFHFFNLAANRVRSFSAQAPSLHVCKLSASKDETTKQ
jgi:hypothetical protein